MKTNRKANVTLWAVQAVLALVFLSAGGMKLVMPIEVLVAQSHMPGEFMRFIGVCEVLGALGLILPGLTRIRAGLTPLAAYGLLIIMTGATLITVARGPVAEAILPLVVGTLAAVVARGRREWASAPTRSYQQPILRKAA